MPQNYYIICASADHVATGKKEGFAQAGHGKRNLLDKLNKSDGIVYYSSKETMDDAKPYQKFTAIGEVKDDEVKQATMGNNFHPFRRNIHYFKSKEADIKLLIDKLEFIKNKQRWGFYLIAGFKQISLHDFELIKQHMAQLHQHFSVNFNHNK